MHKLITLSDAQYENAVEVMKTTRIESFSEFFRHLVLFYEQNQRRSPGRPKGSTEDQEDDTTLYTHPDKHVTEPYTRDELDAYYDFNKVPQENRLYMRKE